MNPGCFVILAFTSSHHRTNSSSLPVGTENTLISVTGIVKPPHVHLSMYRFVSRRRISPDHGYRTCTLTGSFCNLAPMSRPYTMARLDKSDEHGVPVY